MEFEYICEENGISITGFDGTDNILEIPSSIDGFTVISIGKKAFMGQKNLVEVSIPESILKVGDWAFAQCTNLKKVVIKRRADASGEGLLTSLGRGVFDGCKKLENICIKGDLEDDISFLLGACVHRLPALSLLSDTDVGTSFWIDRFDLTLRSFLARDDMEGYDDTALCGEEDISYDGIGSIDGELPGESETFVKEACKNKSFLALLRLMHPTGLSDVNRVCFANYIRSHAFRASNEAAWILIKEDLNSNPSYINLYLDIVSPDKDILSDMIKDTGDKQALLKSCLITCSDTGSSAEDLFSDLMI